MAAQPDQTDRPWLYRTRQRLQLETNTQHVASFTPVSTYCCFCLFLFCHHVRAAPKVLLVCPKEKLLLGAAAPNRPVAVLDVAGADPNKLPVAAAIGLVGPFLPAW